MDARTYLVAVGINDYSSFEAKVPNLKLPVNDAKSIVNLYSHNTSVDYAQLLDKDATNERILKAMNKVFQMAKADDIIVFFFSGHGYNGGVCGSDKKISYNEIRSLMSKSKSNTKILFVDACKSGGFRTVKEAENRKSADSKFVFFLAARTNENSIERIDMQNGLFTEYLIKGLKGNADSNHDRKISTKELFDFVNTRVSIQSQENQHPVMWGNYDDSTIIMQW